MDSKGYRTQLSDMMVWEKALALIREETTRTGYKTWFEPVKKVQIDHDLRIVHLASAEDQVNSVLNDRYKEMLERVFAAVLESAYRVIIDMDFDLQGQGAERNSIIDQVSESMEGADLMPQYRFDNFVVGETNKLAYAVSWEVAKAPALAYNPLFIYSDSGLGKTHLMHAIGNHILEHRPDMKVQYVSAEQFTSELVIALKGNDKSKLHKFKRKYRNVDVLLIDDIHFLAGKSSTQEEFFHTFNQLYNKNKQIVISSDVPPSELKDMPDRLKTRFQWNMHVNIDSPDYETRVAILSSKANEMKVTLDEPAMKALELVAEHISRNVRELEGALTRITSFSAILDKQITPDFVREILTDILMPADRTATCWDVKQAVCKKFHISVKDLESGKRSKDVVVPRHIAMYLCREVIEMSFQKIAREFGNRNHTTVVSACNKITKEMQQDKELEMLITQLLNEL